jgi:hypothetical protein
MFGWVGGSGWVRHSPRGNTPLSTWANRPSSSVVLAGSPPAPEVGAKPQPATTWMAGGRLVAKSLPSKQFPPVAGAPSSRSASPEPDTRLPRTSFPPAIQKLRSSRGMVAMP